MNDREFQDRISILQRENGEIGEEWKKLIAEHEKLREWIYNRPKGFWNCFWFGIQLRLWYDPQVKKIEKRQKKLTERQHGVKENLAILMSGQTPTLH